MLRADRNLPYFFFGTLMDPDVLTVVLDRPAETVQRTAARLERFRRARVRGESYPVLEPSEDGIVHGLLVLRLTELETRRIAYYEGDEYRLVRLDVICGEGVQSALAFAEATSLATDGEWDFTRWQREEKQALLEAARDFMARFGDAHDPETADARWLEAKQQAMVRTRSR